jgi:cytochrome c-type biogenesis protein CcmH/NrfG
LQFIPVEPDVKKEQVAMLVGGFAFGVLVGFGLAQIGGGPAQVGSAGPPQQRQAPPPSQSQAQATAPMLAEIGQLREVLKLDPANLGALKRMGNLYHDAGMWPQAVEFYEKAVELSPDDPNLLTDLGTCYGGMRRNDEAIAMFSRANGIDPNHWQSLYNTVIIAGLNAHDFATAEAALAKLANLPAGQQHIPQLQQALAQARAEHPD